MLGGFFDFNEAKTKRKVINNNTRRVLFLLGLLVVAASLQNYKLLLAEAIVVLALCLWAQIKWSYVFLRMLFLVPFGLGAIVLLPFTVEGKERDVFWGFTVSEEGLSIALLLISKLMVCHFIICLLLSTTTPSELFKTLRKLGVPNVLVEIMKITLRYLAVLFEEIERMMIAQQSRGLTFKSFSTWSAYQRSGELLGVLLIRSYHRSRRIHEAMVSRGFINENKET